MIRYTQFIFLLFVTANIFAQVSLDSTFGNNGKVHTGFGDSNAKANAVAVQPDGKIIVGGSAYTANTVNSWETDTNNAVLVRYNIDGSLDTTFGYEGKVMSDIYVYYHAQGWNSGVYSIKVQPDGKILTYEFVALGYSAITVLARYNADGSVDTGFGANGKVTCDSSPVQGNNSLIIQPDDKILVLGIQALQPTPNVYVYYFVIERFNADGSYDTAFGTEGKQLTAIGLGGSAPNAMSLQSDGKILVVGQSASNFAIARYTPGGALDSTFDSDGVLTTSFGTGTYSSANFMKTDPNGKILVAGTTSNTAGHYFAISKYNPNGSLDTSFDSDGKATTLFDTADTSVYIYSVVGQADGKLLITTTANPNSYTYDIIDDFVIRRYNNDATPDSTFGTNGKVAITLQTGFNISKSIAIQADEKIVVCGYSHPSESEQNDFNVVRYQSNGDSDTSFDNDGTAGATFDTSNDECHFLLIQPDGKLITIGTKRNSANNPYASDIAISRTTSSGSLDPSFGINGKIVSVFEQNSNRVTNAVIQPDGKIIVSNTYFNVYVDNLYHYELIRYTAAGAIDSTFGIDGRLSVDKEVITMLCQANGKIITTSLGYDLQNNTLIVLNSFNSNGTPDTTFGINGTVSAIGSTTTAAIQADGKTVVSAVVPTGPGTSGSTIMRFNIDGSLDSTFESALTAFNPDVKAIFIQPDGKIVVAGRKTSYADNLDSYYFEAARFNSNGSVDTTFGSNGIIDSYLGNYYSTTYSILQSVVLQSDGKLIVAMSMAELNPASPTPNLYDFLLYRFNPDGTFDNDFGSNGQITTAFYNKYDEAFAMVLQPDNKLVVAGTTDTGINRDFALVRYDNVVLSVSEFGDDASPLNFIIYPNPVRDLLNIKSESDNLQIIDYKIINLLGQIMHKGSQHEMTIDTGNFSRGIYTIVVRTNEGNFTKKFIKE